MLCISRRFSIWFIEIRVISTPRAAKIKAYNDTVDQFFRFEEGNGSVVINGKKHTVKDGGGVIVPCGAAHNVINTSRTAALKLYTIYSPPNHLDKVVRKTKQDALAKEEHFDGKTTE